MMSEECPECGKEFDMLGQHFNTYTDHRPDIDTEIVTGLLMGDGCLAKRDTKNSYLTINMTNKTYLEYLDSEFGCLSTGVSLKNSSKEQADLAISGGLNPDAKENNYKNMYTLNTRKHPTLSNFNSWYYSGKKEFPSDLDLTPKVLKHWYVCDGSYESETGRVSIAISNEIDRIDNIYDMFNRAGLPEPDYNHSSDRKNRSGKRCMIRFNKDSALELFEYMGETVDGFKYKFPQYTSG